MRLGVSRKSRHASKSSACVGVVAAALRRSVRLFQNGGPRAGESAGTSVGSPRWSKNLSMLAGFVTSAMSLARAPQRLQA